MRKILILFVLILILSFLSSKSTDFFYDIVSDFYIMDGNTYLVFYYSFNLQRPKYQIMGLNLETDKMITFSYANEYPITQPYFNPELTVFSYGSLVEGNDLVWVKDFDEKSGYKILYNISGRLTTIKVSPSREKLLLGFGIASPQQYLYISGIRKMYTYKLLPFPDIVTTGFSRNETFAYVIYKINSRYFFEMMNIPQEVSDIAKFTPLAKRVISDFVMHSYNDNYIYYEFDGKNFIYLINELEVKEVETFIEIPSLYDSNNRLIYSDGLWYRQDMLLIDVPKKFYDVIEFKNSKIKYIFPYILIGDQRSIYIYYQDDSRVGVYEVTRLADFPIDTVLFFNELPLAYLVGTFTGGVFQLWYIDKAFANKKIVYSSSFYSVDKVAQAGTMFYILGKKNHSLGLLRELYSVDFEKKSESKIYGLESLPQAQILYTKKPLK